MHMLSIDNHDVFSIYTDSNIAEPLNLTPLSAKFANGTFFVKVQNSSSSETLECFITYKKGLRMLSLF